MGKKKSTLRIGILGSGCLLGFHEVPARSFDYETESELIV